MSSFDVAQGWEGPLLPLVNEAGTPFETWKHLRSLVGKALTNLGIDTQDIKRMQAEAHLDPIVFAKDEDWPEFIPVPTTGINDFTRRVIAELAMSDGVVVHEETVTWSVGDMVFIGERPHEDVAA